MKFDESGDSMNNFYDDVFSHEIKTPSTLPVSIAKGNLTNKEFVKFRENFKRSRNPKLRPKASSYRSMRSQMSFTN